MDTIYTVLISILVFGLLIFIHEFGHYICARIFKVKILEFSIGMGPKLVEYKSKKTDINYAISSIPIGGYVAMAGEDGESDDPNSFDRKPAWQRLIITVAGAAVNILAGFIVMLIYTCLVDIGGTTVAQFIPKETTGFEISSSESGLCSGDEIVAVEGKRVRIADELSYEVMRRGYEPITLTVIRDGEEMDITVEFPTIGESGQTFGCLDFSIYGEKKTFGSVISYAFSKGALLVRMCWESVYDLIVGRYTFEAVSGPVGISSAIGDAAKAGALQLLYLTALISINLGVMNLLPFPALDGGRLLTILIEIITRRRIPQKIEGIINAVGLFILLGFSAVVLVKDVFALIF